MNLIERITGSLMNPDKTMADVAKESLRVCSVAVQGGGRQRREVSAYRKVVPHRLLKGKVRHAH
jgi:hypothetical protein